MRAWLDLDCVTVGMARQSYNLQLTRYGDQGLARYVLPGGARALRHVGGRVGLGAGAVDGGAAGGVGKSAEAGS